MAAFSPSPAPRHLTRNASRGPTPPTGTMRRPRVGISGRPSNPSSRVVTPATQHDRLQSIGDQSVESGMDVDERSDPLERGGSKAELLFAKSEELEVTFYAHLPAEVKQILHNADFDREPYTGDVDTVTGFALVASSNTCFVWKYAQALAGTPTCYIFECPQDVGYLAMATPFHALVPYGASREPGLILMTSAGHIRFWDGLAMGLAGGKNYSKSSLDFVEDELVTSLIRADPQTYVVSTSTGRLFRLSLTSAGSRYQLASRVFGRPQSALSLSRFFPSLWSAEGLQPVEGNIDAVALGQFNRETSRRDLWVLVEYHIQRWSISAEGWEALEYQESIFELVLGAVRSRFTSATQDNIELNLEFVDLKSPSDNRLVLLVSFAGQESEEEMMIETTPRRIYAIVQLSARTGSFKVDSVRSVPYQSVCVSQFLIGRITEHVVGDNEYMDRLELKSRKDRTFGLGSVDGDSDVLVLTAGILMRALIDEEAVAKFDPEHGRANLIKSTMTQSILYGSNPENPLYFSFPPEIDSEALMSGAEQLSQAILESETQVVRPNHDLQAQMTSRKERLSFLIKFINDNAVISKMSQSSRQRLATGAEKLYAAHQLWLRATERMSYVNARNTHSSMNLSPTRTSNPYTILPEAVYTYMRGVGEGHHEDFMRAFFRLKVDDIGSLFPHLLALVRASDQDITRDVLTIAPQANGIILTILQSALAYREYNAGVYGIELPLIRPWTSSPAVLDILTELFDVTTKLIETSANDLEPSRRRTEAKSQLPQLASVLFETYHERLAWLSSPIAADDPESEREKEIRSHRFKQLRPEVLDTLRRNGFSAEAFKLAEDFRDFRSLASLCHKDVVYPPQRNPNAERIQLYIERFKEDFTTELYQWYVEHGELRAMFAQDHGDYLDKFFVQRPNTSISWIHDFGKGRFGVASESLLAEAETASELETKHLMLSLGKLSHLAQLHEKEASHISESVLDAFHDGLDFVSVHETLLEELKTALASVHVRQSLEMQVDTIVKAKASTLENFHVFQNVFKQFVRRLLQGKALSVEDTADVLSLKDNKDTLDDYVTALHLLSFAKNLPDSRRLSAFRSVWRRIYIHDDWDSIRKTSGATDAELNERFKNTALFTVLQATLHKKHQPNGYLLLPDEVLSVPEQDEIASRWPGLPPEEIDEMKGDYEAESARVEELQLGEAFERVKELVLGE